MFTCRQSLCITVPLIIFVYKPIGFIMESIARSVHRQRLPYSSPGQAIRVASLLQTIYYWHPCPVLCTGLNSISFAVLPSHNINIVSLFLACFILVSLWKYLLTLYIMSPFCWIWNGRCYVLCFRFSFLVGFVDSSCSGTAAAMEYTSNAPSRPAHSFAWPTRVAFFHRRVASKTEIHPPWPGRDCPCN